MKNFNPYFKKNLKYVFSLFLISIIISCSQPKQDAITQEDIEAMKKEHLISLNDAINMYKKYDKDRVKILKDTLEKKYKNPKFKDTRMVWFSLKDIKAYLKYLEQETDEAEGLAFYFGVDSGNGQKKDHQTFFIAPTIKNVVNGDTIQSGYTRQNGKKVFLYKRYKLSGSLPSEDNIQKANFLGLRVSEDGYIFNDGRENPPFPDN